MHELDTAPDDGRGYEPFAGRPDQTTELRPDGLVGRKKAAHERMGVPSYRVVDPRKISLTVFELDSTPFPYQQVADVPGHRAFDATQPVAVRVVPADLLDGLHPEPG